MKISKAVKSQCLKKNGVNLFELDGEEIDTFGIMDEIKKQIDKMLKTVKCAKMVVEKEVAGTDYKKYYDELKMKVNGILKNDTKKCAEMKGLKDKFV